jgi:hypothetical protein
MNALCALCDQLDETTDHLLCSCVFAREVWSWLLSSLGFLAATPHQDDTLLGWWLVARTTFPQALQRSFDFLVLLVSWCLWRERNCHTFDHQASTMTKLLSRILDEVNIWIGAGFGCLALLTALAA